MHQNLDRKHRNIFFKCYKRFNQHSILQLAEATAVHKNVYVTTKINIALPITEAIVRRCPAKKLFLKISGNWQKSICTEVFYLIKLQVSSLSCECCKNFKNTYFVEHLRTAASAGMILQMNKCTVQVKKNSLMIAKCLNTSLTCNRWSSCTVIYLTERFQNVKMNVFSFSTVLKYKRLVLGPLYTLSQ